MARLARVPRHGYAGPADVELFGVSGIEDDENLSVGKHDTTWMSESLQVSSPSPFIATTAYE